MKKHATLIISIIAFLIIGAIIYFIFIKPKAAADTTAATPPTPVDKKAQTAGLFGAAAGDIVTAIISGIENKNSKPASEQTKIS